MNNIITESSALHAGKTVFPSNLREVKLNTLPLLHPATLTEFPNLSGQDKAKLKTLLLEIQPCLVQLELEHSSSAILEIAQRLRESISITPIEFISTDGLPKIDPSDALDYDRFFGAKRVDSDNLVGCLLVGLLSALQEFLELQYLYEFDRNTLDLAKQGFKSYIYLLFKICG